MKFLKNIDINVDEEIFLSINKRLLRVKKS